ncbi:MAG: hypothetical protein P4L64_17355 [Caulobacteraceae bacterium]|nr:hypothetical protein [Caulobacteraceae bacterium]
MKRLIHRLGCGPFNLGQRLLHLGKPSFAASVDAQPRIRTGREKGGQRALTPTPADLEGSFKIEAPATPAAPTASMTLDPLSD